MNDQSPPQAKLPHPSLSLTSLSNLSQGDYDLLATEVNSYLTAIRTRAGRTLVTAKEVQVLFNRMLDVMVITPGPTAAEPADLDHVRSLEETMLASPKAIAKRPVA